MTVIVTKLRQEDGVWTARVSDGNGHTVDVDRRYGSWQALVPRVRGSSRRVRRDVTATTAAALQAKVLPLERAARKNDRAGKRDGGER